MSTLRRRILVTAAVPAAALGFLLAAPGVASASPATPQAPASASDDWHGHHHHHGLNLNLHLVLGLQLTGHGWDDGDCDGYGGLGLHG